MATKVELTVDDEVAEALVRSVNSRRDHLAMQRERLRTGARTGSQVEELSETEKHDTDLSTAVRYAVEYAVTEFDE